ncbi:MAG TPA: hypothetical protein DCW83_00950 [Saprospirales bacterium]|nr:hypothetical protein [Saprospirales bacterium]
MMKMYLVVVVVVLLNVVSHSQILIDESYDDWNDVVLYSDPIGDGSNFGDDFTAFQVTNDDEYLYFRIELRDEILLQEDNRINIYIDTDNNANTGTIQAGIGAEIGFEFGDRRGFIRNGNATNTIFHNDIGITVLPSLSSKIFEFALSRTYFAGGAQFIDGTIAVACKDNRSGGDIIPNSAADRLYTLVDNNNPTLPKFDFLKVGNGFRMMTYNSLFDGLFEFGQSQQQRRMIKAMDADIYTFVEIYDFNSGSIVDIIEDETGYTNWDHASEGSDTHVISKYPIKDHTNIDGNGAYILDYEGNDMLIIVAHLPAGSNDESRQAEVDKIAAFIRDAKLGLNEFQLATNAPILITGDMNLYGNKRQRETLTTGDIINNNAYGPDASPDWDGTPLTAALPFASGLPQAVTWINPNSSFFPGRLDYTFYSDHTLDLTNTFCLNTNDMEDADLEVLGLNRNDSRSASDHLPVITDFEIIEPNRQRDLTLEDINTRVFPNPATNLLHIDSKTEISSIIITDVMGEVVFRSNNISKENTINATEWNSGTYLIQLITIKGSVTEKMFKF